MGGGGGEATTEQRTDSSTSISEVTTTTIGDIGLTGTNIVDFADVQAAQNFSLIDTITAALRDITADFNRTSLENKIVDATAFNQSIADITDTIQIGSSAQLGTTQQFLTDLLNENNLTTREVLAQNSERTSEAVKAIAAATGVSASAITALDGNEFVDFLRENTLKILLVGGAVLVLFRFAK